MELGIEGKTAIVCASSSGLGLACAKALAAEGANLVLNGRNERRLVEAAKQISGHYGVRVVTALGDVSTESGRCAILGSVESPDILVTNNSGPAPVSFVASNAETWKAALQANMIAPLEMIRGVLPGMIKRKFGRIINITSGMVTTPKAHMTQSAGSRAGLTAAVKGLSLDVVKFNVTINNLLPERFDTPRQAEMAHAASIREGITLDEARSRQVAAIAAGRFGRPEECGAACAFLCSEWAGYISGQNLHLDGGSYPGLV
jgi:3-oxoacyl-[acyl-carrier protein] reductase